MVRWKRRPLLVAACITFVALAGCAERGTKYDFNDLGEAVAGELGDEHSSGEVPRPASPSLPELIVYAANIPEFLDGRGQRELVAALEDAETFWASEGHQVEIRIGSPRGDERTIYWSKELGGALGRHYGGTGDIQVGLGDSNCGHWLRFDKWSWTGTIAHEIGHALGFDHDANGPAVMWESHGIYDGWCWREPAAYEDVEYGAWAWRGIDSSSHQWLTFRAEEPSGRAVTICIGLQHEFDRYEDDGTFEAIQCKEDLANWETSRELPPGEYGVWMRCDDRRGCDFILQMGTK